MKTDKPPFLPIRIAVEVNDTEYAAKLDAERMEGVDGARWTLEVTERKIDRDAGIT